MGNDRSDFVDRSESIPKPSNKKLTKSQIEARKLLHYHVSKRKAPKKISQRQGDRFAHMVGKMGW